MSYLYRCKNRIKHGPAKGQQCDARRALPRRVEEYIRKPKCKQCGAYLSYEDKWQRRKNRDKDNLCWCDGLPFTPHRKASTVWCMSHPTGPTEKDYLERYGGGYEEEAPGFDRENCGGEIS